MQPSSALYRYLRSFEVTLECTGSLDFSSMSSGADTLHGHRESEKHMQSGYLDQGARLVSRGSEWRVF